MKEVMTIEPNKEYIRLLINEKNWSHNKLAMKAGVSKTTISRWFNDKRGAGKGLISGILRAFPNEPIEKLFLMDRVEPNSTKTKTIHIVKGVE